MTLPTEDGPRGVAPAVALYSIIGFWFFYAVLISLRAAVVGFDSQIEMAARRAVVTLIGIIVTWVLYLVLRRFDGKPLMIRVVAAFSLAAPFALAMAAANFYVFNIYDPVSMFPDADHEKYTQQGYALTAILEDALSRYFFLAAWAGLYLALSYASEAHRTERRAARLERAALRRLSAGHRLSSVISCSMRERPPWSSRTMRMVWTLPSDETVSRTSGTLRMACATATSTSRAMLRPRSPQSRTAGGVGGAGGTGGIGGTDEGTAGA